MNVRPALDVSALEKKARKIRLEILEAAVKGGKSHLGGTFSCVDLLVALYYGGVFRFDPAHPSDPNRDRFILSKGHACQAIYAIFKDVGLMSAEVYESYGKDGGLGGQLDMAIPGVDFITGSLGHSIGVSSGMALAAKMNKTDVKAFTMIGDAELFEGSVWEAMICADEHRLNNVIVIIDRNRLSVTAALEDDSVFRNFKEKTINFGWDFYEMDGHKMNDILNVLGKAVTGNKPAMIVANTVKGKGVSFMENNLKWHTGLPGEAELIIARKELAN